MSSSLNVSRAFQGQWRRLRGIPCDRRDPGTDFAKRSRRSTEELRSFRGGTGSRDRDVQRRDRKELHRELRGRFFRDWERSAALIVAVISWNVRGKVTNFICQAFASQSQQSCL